MNRGIDWICALYVMIAILMTVLLPSLIWQTVRYDVPRATFDYIFWSSYLCGVLSTTVIIAVVVLFYRIQKKEEY